MLAGSLKKSKLGINGFTTIFNVVEFPRALSFEALTVIYPNLEDYQESPEISTALLQKGNPLPTIDMIVSAMCIRRNLVLCTKDNHFKSIKKVRASFKLELTK